MSIVGIVVAKSESTRLKNKNILEKNGVPMFWNSVQPMLNSELIDKVVVSTDSNFIKSYCESKNVEVIWRNKNSSLNDEPILNVLNYTYKSLNERYDKILCILANSPGHTEKDIEKAVKIMKDNNLNEIRSFNTNGVENGLILLKENIVLSEIKMSTYIGGIFNNINEIHYKEDL